MGRSAALHREANLKLSVIIPVYNERFLVRELLRRVLAVEIDGVMAKIDLACGPYRIVSLMSREAAEDLALKPGDVATAVVKSTTVIVERG